MGCFSLFPCFTSSKSNKSVNSFTSADQECKKNPESVLIKVPTQESTNLSSLHIPIWKSSESQVIIDSDIKTSAIDIDAKTNVKEGYGKLQVLVQLEVAKERADAVKKENEKLGVLDQIENERKKERKTDSSVQVEIENDNKIEVVPKEEDQRFEFNKQHENESDVEKEVKAEANSPAISDSSVSSYISYPPMHRYHNSVINEVEDQVVIQENSSESLFSLSIDQRRQSKSCLVEVDDKEVNSPLKTNSSPKKIAKLTSFCPDENDYDKAFDSLLNPIENIAQWKTMKTVSPTPNLDFHQEKENFNLEQEDIPIPVSEDPSFKVFDMKGKVKNNTAVTTSLSSWLVDPEKSMTVSKEESQYSTGNSNSYAYSDGARSFEDRPILGAWTIDEVKQISARSSPRKSPCRNPDETPIIGTVGSYWSHTMQATDSSSSCTSPFGMSAKSRRNRENKALSCHSSPTKRRLEKAFNKTAV
ncbi:hypothetical protein E3N88_02969 [Mikania micrantha]|uniref:Uncharacterized protein n=1 Tax=Mikania micrantha TaxID=192012 RepID=A0A5N6Q5N1_9ASTR|nr:hypothetical protein E3N88_02969 [Mikania micrantha]